MSLTSDITRVIERADALIDVFEGTSSAIQARIDQLAAAGRDTLRIVSVNAISGNDQNPGSVEQPYGTLAHAIEANAGTPVLVVNLYSDVALTKRVNTASRTIIIQGFGGGGSLRRTLSPAAEASNSPNWQGHRVAAGIIFDADGALQLRDIDLALPDVPEAIISRSFVSSNSGITAILRDVQLSIASPTSVASFMEAWSPAPVRLWASSTVLTPDVAGHVVSGIPAGANPNANTSNRFVSNLTSL